MYRLTALEVQHCVHCGTESQPTWRFCRRCGTALENLDQQPTEAHCASCATPVAAGWRFCASCGTGTESATDIPAGLSDDDVADLIAAPGVATAPSAVPSAAESAPADDAAWPAAHDDSPVAPDATAPTSAFGEIAESAAADLAAEAAPADAHTEGWAPIEAGNVDEPEISGPKVSFEPGIEGEGNGIAGSDRAVSPPPPTADMMTAPPPPPLDPTVPDTDDIVAAKATAEAPPEAAARMAAQAEVVADASPTGDIVDAEIIEARVVETEIVEPQQPVQDPFAPSEAGGPASPVGDAAAPPVVEEGPAVVIPVGEDEVPTIRPTIPQPLDSPASQVSREIPQPVAEPDPTAPDLAAEPGSLADRVRSSVEATPARTDAAPPTSVVEHDELPPLDGRRFRNPGLMGQGLQLALLASAAFAVAMIVGLILLNNRLDAYATSGEGLARITSAESLVNTWLRPLVIAALVGTYALLITWARRVQDNLAVFNNEVEETPLWMWLMPIANMWVLFRHLDLSWKGADHYARGVSSWDRGRPDVWTVTFVLLPVIGFLLIAYAWTLGAETFATALDANAFAMIGYAMLALGLLAGVRSVANIISKQRARAESQSR